MFFLAARTMTTEGRKSRRRSSSFLELPKKI
jgi:hypothetical protein